jgi:hypothetical protein
VHACEANNPLSAEKLERSIPHSLVCNELTDLRSVWLPRQFSQPLPEHLLRLDIKVLVPEEYNTAL